MYPKKFACLFFIVLTSVVFERTRAAFADDFLFDPIVVKSSGVATFPDKVENIFPQFQQVQTPDLREVLEANLDYSSGRLEALDVVQADGAKTDENRTLKIELGFTAPIELDAQVATDGDIDIAQAISYQLEQLSEHHVDLKLLTNRDGYFIGYADIELASISDNLQSFPFSTEIILKTVFTIVADKHPTPIEIYSQVVKETNYNGRGGFKNPGGLEIFAAEEFAERVFFAFEMEPGETNAYFLNLATTLIDHIVKKGDISAKLAQKVSMLPSQREYSKLSPSTRAAKFQQLALVLARKKNAQQSVSGGDTSYQELARLLSRSISFPTSSVSLGNRTIKDYRRAAVQRLQVTCVTEPTDCPLALEDFRKHHAVFVMGKQTIRNALLAYMTALETMGEWQELNGVDNLDYARNAFNTNLRSHWVDFAAFTHCDKVKEDKENDQRGRQQGWLRIYLESLPKKSGWKKRLEQADEVARLSYLLASNGSLTDSDITEYDISVLRKTDKEVIKWLCSE